MLQLRFDTSIFIIRSLYDEKMYVLFRLVQFSSEDSFQEAQRFLNVFSRQRFFHGLLSNRIVQRSVAYEEKEIYALREDGSELKAKTYIYPVSRSEKKFVKPSEEYLNICRKGYRKHGLQVKPLEAAAIYFPIHQLEKKQKNTDKLIIFCLKSINLLNKKISHKKLQIF